MIEIEEAVGLVAANCQPLPIESVELSRVAGRVLAEDIVSDVDSPPFDKSMMDGFAIIAADSKNDDGHPRPLKIVARIMAGMEFDGQLQAGQATQIMTGAPVPNGADSVVMVEETSEENGHVTITAASLKTGQNILTRGLAMTSGQSVLDRGHVVRREDIGVLAEAGADTCKVITRPSVAVIATGDELIDVAQKPIGSQIRNSNGPMLESLAQPYCDTVANLGIGLDDQKQLGEKIQLGLKHDVLVLSGGVSAGVADLVPGLLKEAGVEQVFHKVKIKPGKPIWFGVLKRTSADERNTFVFGLPGNPVSSMICFRVFVAPALLRLAGLDPSMEMMTATLSEPHSQRGGRTTYWPARVDLTDTGHKITPLPWKGSADLRTLAEANCFAVFPGDRDQFPAGQSVQVYRMAQ